MQERMRLSGGTRIHNHNALNHRFKATLGSVANKLQSRMQRCLLDVFTGRAIPSAEFSVAIAEATDCFKVS
jgi:hypothetical protein